MLNTDGIPRENASGNARGEKTKGKGMQMQQRQQHIEARATCGHRGQRGLRGFSLIEIMVAIGIVAIIAGVGVPSLSGILKNIKINAISSALVASLQQARGEAIKSNRGVLVCPSNSAATDCAGSTDWGINGWLLCYDSDADSICDPSTDTLPNPIRVEGKVESAFAEVLGPPNPIRFTPSGSQGVTGAGMVTVTIKGAWSGAVPLSITVAGSGLIKGSRATGGA
jgi:prepilin-type N-terminal cleavage/methylation domain-containing protein